MAEVVVTGEEEPGTGETAAAAAAHQAAVAEGVTGVQAAQASDAAAEAKEAAAAAVEAAQVNAASQAAAEEAAAEATASAAASAVTLEMIHEQQNAMLAGLDALKEELKASRKPAAPARPDGAPKADRPPAGRTHWINRPIGKKR